MTLTQLQQFFLERPQLSAQGTALECGLSPRLVAYILTGERSLTKRSIEKLRPVLIKYGWKDYNKDDMLLKILAPLGTEFPDPTGEYCDLFAYLYDNIAPILTK